MIYDNNDNHITVKLLKKKGWILFEVYSSRCSEANGESGGWWIETSVAHDTEHAESHRKIQSLFLGCTLKGAISTLKSDKVPYND
jgi:hypothetical protein